MKIMKIAKKNILKMSMREWHEIGLRSHWLKIAEPINIDGKWYDEINGELVEVNNPEANKVTKEKKKVSVNRYDPPIIFEEGGIYEDGLGKYVVVSISDNNEFLDVKYLKNDQVKRYKVLDRAKIIHNEQVRREQTNRMSELGFSGSKEFFALGYLASKGIIHAQIPISQRTWFEEMYLRLTGDKAQIGPNYDLAKDESKYTLQLRIKFEEPDDQYLSQMNFKNATVIRTKTGLEISDNNFIKNLFIMGFKLANNRINKGSILNKIPQEKVGDFEAGFKL